MRHINVTETFFAGIIIAINLEKKEELITKLKSFLIFTLPTKLNNEQQIADR